MGTNAVSHHPPGSSQSQCCCSPQISLQSPHSGPQSKYRRILIMQSRFLSSACHSFFSTRGVFTLLPFVSLFDSVLSITHAYKHSLPVIPVLCTSMKIFYPCQHFSLNLSQFSLFPPSPCFSCPFPHLILQAKTS